MMLFLIKLFGLSKCDVLNEKNCTAEKLGPVLAVAQTRWGDYK